MSTDYWKSGWKGRPLSGEDLETAIQACIEAEEAKRAKYLCLHGSEMYLNELQAKGIDARLGICMGCGWPIPVPLGTYKKNNDETA